MRETTPIRKAKQLSEWKQYVINEWGLLRIEAALKYERPQEYQDFLASYAKTLRMLRTKNS